jgi:hypothetical protein
MRLILLGALMLPMLCGIARGQSDERLEKLERRLDELETKLKARDEEIARLKSSATRPAAPAADEVERTKQAILRDIEENRSPPLTLRTPVSLNPDIAVIGNFVGSVSTLNDNPARNRFDIREVELDIRAAVDPRADAVVVLPFIREMEDPLFFDPADATGDVESGVEVEEAYLFLHDVGVPNLTAKLGRYHLRFGRQNVLHPHDLPTVDNNFVNQSFLGAEAITDSGLSLSYVVPPRLVGDNYVEAIVEIVSGEGGEETPVVNNSAFVDSPALNTHLLWNHDVARDWNIELGGSWLTSKRNDDSHLHANLFGADFTLIHTDPTGGFFNQLFQLEGIYGDVDIARDDTQHAYGGYLLGQQQLNRDWYAGLRLDWTKNAVDDTQEVWGVAPYLSWYWSEFLRFRVEYQHKDGDVPSEDTLYFQATWVFGAHPPHPYWSMK